MASNPALTLKAIYEAAGKAQDYFEAVGPDIFLYRAQTQDDFEKNVFILSPRYEGPGPKDVHVVEREGKLWVLGCSAVSGKNHTGVSTFDRPVYPTKNHTKIYKIPKGVKLPENLAITKDKFSSSFKATHYSIAPKNDMELPLFFASLKIVADACTLEKIGGEDEGK
jgi:hypothetical protein